MKSEIISLDLKTDQISYPAEGEEDKSVVAEIALTAMNAAALEGEPASLENRVSVTPTTSSKTNQWVATRFIILDIQEQSKEAEKEDAERKRAALEEIRSEITRTTVKKQAEKHEEIEFEENTKHSNRNL